MKFLERISCEVSDLGERVGKLEHSVAIFEARLSGLDKPQQKTQKLLSALLDYSIKNVERLDNRLDKIEERLLALESSS